MIDLTVITTYRGDRETLHDNSDYLIGYASDHDIRMQWMIIVSHADSGEVIETTCPSNSMSLQIVSVDNVNKVKPSYIKSLVRGAQMATVEELTQHAEPVSA